MKENIAQTPVSTELNYAHRESESARVMIKKIIFMLPCCV